MMDIRQELSQKLLQKLVLTPQLQLAIRLLQLSRLELVEEVRRQLEANPVLEEEAPDSGEVVSLEEVQSQSEGEESGEARRENEEELAEKTGEDRLARGELEAWARFVEGYSRFSTGPQIRLSTEEIPSLEATVSRKPTLHEHLLWQLQLSELGEQERRVGAFIIGNIDDSGYLKDITLEEIAEATGVSLEVAEKVLRKVQTFDPVGVAARDVRECLLIQARVHHPGNEKLERLILQHLGDLERKNFGAIARGLRCSLDEVKALVETVRSMDPKPGRAFGGEEVVSVEPDVYVIKVGDEYVTLVNEDGLPKLRISAYYEQMLAGGVASPEAREFLQEKLRSAFWLIRSIHQRHSTIRKVTESIMRFQRAFLEKGVSHLRPLVLRDVAEDVGLHESTVSRVTTNKYVYTPRGIFELKYFFNSRVGSLSGDEVSSEAVKARIKEIVEKEDPRRPLSDGEIARILRRENVVVARRTVAKYRQALGILPSSRRRSLA